MNATNKRTSLNEDEKRAVDAVLKSVSASFSVDSFILFGSKARCDANAESDVDLLIVTRRELDYKEMHRITNFVLQANLEYNTSITGVVVSKKEWESELWSILPFRINVMREGVNLV